MILKLALQSKKICHLFRSSITNGVARIGELAADSAESINGFAEGVYDAATVVPNGVAAVAREKKVGIKLLLNDLIRISIN